MVDAETLELIEQAIGLKRQGIQPACEASFQQQGLQQVLHIHGAMAPTASRVLGGQEQLPGVFAEAIWFAGEAWGHGLSGQPREESWISSTL